MQGKCALLTVVYILGGAFSLFSPAESANTVKVTHISPAVYSTPFLIRNNRILTYISVNGREEELFLVDNGWHKTTVDSRRINDMSFMPTKNTLFKAIHRRIRQGSVGSVPRMKLGDLEIINPEVMSSDIFPALSKNLRFSVKGVLGCQTIEPYLTTLDFKTKSICFTFNTHETVTAIRGHRDVITLPFGPNPLSKADKHVFSVQIYINDVPVYAFLDTGFSGCILTNVNHNDLSLPVNFHGRKTYVAVIGQEGNGYPSAAREIRLGDHIERNVKVLYFESNAKPRITLLGIEFLQRFTVTLDYENRFLYLVPASSGCADKYFRFQPCDNLRM